jgi:hypothetical protein
MILFINHSKLARKGLEVWGWKGCVWTKHAITRHNMSSCALRLAGSTLVKWLIHIYIN